MPYAAHVRRNLEGHDGGPSILKNRGGRKECTAHTDEILDFQLQQSISKLARVNISITTRKVLEKPRHVEKKVTTKEEITLLFIKWLLRLLVVVPLLAINLSLKTADAEPASSFVVVVNNIFVF